MKFRLKTDTLGPKMGDIRRRFVFCWRPKKTEDGFWVWLETVLVTEKYTRLTRLIPESKAHVRYSAWLVTESFSSKNTLFQEYVGKI